MVFVNINHARKKISPRSRMNFLLLAYMALLFAALTPGVFISLPMRGSKYMCALTHGVIFALVWHFTHRTVWRMTEGFQDMAEGKKMPVPTRPSAP
jgi:hypothetical protein